jgi:SAM-dependent methyltransferase
MIRCGFDGPQAAERASMSKARFLRSLLAENGLVWTFGWGLSQLLKGLLGWVDRSLQSLERRRGLPGLSVAAINRSIWDAYDWRRRGEEWTPSAEWKQSLATLIQERAPEQGAILEIGPGAGRWTEALQRLAGSLTVVDVSRASIEACRARFADCENVRYLVNDGRTLPGIADESIDFIWSFDTFVHVAPEDTAAYAGEFRRVLRRGGRGIVHHPAAGGLRGGFRSRMTSEAFVALLRSSGLAPLEQFDAWGPQGAFDVKHFGDAITVFAKE